MLLIGALFMLPALPFSLSSPAISPAVALAAQTTPLQACTLKTGPQGGGEMAALCGVVQVPENWAQEQSGGRKLDLHVAVVPAKNKDAKQPPIFHMEGGPGASAIKMFSEIWYSAYTDLNQDHDIVLIDQRGTGQSASLQCTELTETSLADLATDVGDDPKEFAPDLEACLTRLAATNDPALFTTAALVEDTNAVRQALGYDRINLFGSSYGTWQAQFYLARYGEHVNAAVLEGVIGPWDNGFVEVGPNFEEALNKTFALCEADTACNAAYPDLPGKLAQALERLDKQPAEVTGTSSLTGKNYPVLVTRARLLDALRNMPAQGSLIAAIPQAVAQAALGAYTLPATVLVALAEQGESMSMGQHYSILCAEVFAFVTDEQVKQVAGSFYGQGEEYVNAYREACKVWRSAEIDAAALAPAAPNVPTLLLSGAFDPITPTKYAEATAARLPNSTLAVFPYEGHGILPFNGCAQRLAAAIYANPAQKPDTSCTANNPKPAFIGAYRVKFVPFQDPAGRFTANVPEGWSLRPNSPGDTMTFLQSPEAVPQVLGIAVHDGLSGTELHDAAGQAVMAAFGPLEQQATLSQLGVTISQFGLKIDGEVYIGGLLSFGLFNQSRAVWYAAPPNIFTAGFTDLVTAIFTSVVPR